MEQEDDEAIAILRLRSWPEIDVRQLTDAALSPSLHRLLLVQGPCFSARLLDLRTKCAVSLPHAATSFAWGCQADRYASHGAAGPFQELLFTCNKNGLVIYGFPRKVSDHGMDPISISSFEVELGCYDVDKPRLVFLEAETWPALVSLVISSNSPSFSRMVEFASKDSERSDLSGGNYTITALVPNSSCNLMAMLLRQQDSGIRTAAIIRVSEWDICWIARVLLDMKEDWVDFTFVSDRFLGLTGNGRIFVWEASTGNFVCFIDVPGATTSVLRLFPAKSRPLVGVTDKLGQIFLVSLDCQAGAMPSWELANSDIWNRENGTRPALTPSSFTPKRLLTAGVVPEAKTTVLRKVLLPCVSSCEILAMAISSCSVTKLFRSNGITRLTQSSLYCSTDPDAMPVSNMETVVSSETLGLSFQGAVYLVSASSLAVVLPPVVDANHPGSLWWLTSPEKLSSTLSFLTLLPQLRQWQTAVLDRCLLYDGLDEAEHLFLENGWDIRLARLRKLQLALDYQRTDEIATLLNKLIPVRAAEAGVLRVIFTAVELMLNRFGSDNELLQAARLLALGARFTRELIKLYGVKASSDSGHETPEAHVELAQFLETMRTLQEHLHSRKKRSKTEKEDSGADVTERGEKAKSTALVEPSEADELVVLSPAEDDDHSRRHPSQESPKEMIARWDRENVSIFGVVKDALRAGRIPLAVVELHHRKGTAGTGQLEADVFKEVRDVGRAIVYDLLCKGKTPIALAALRRLGEDIQTVLHDLAFGTVRRSLRSHATKELRRHGHLDPRDYRLLQVVSRIENLYPSNKFWKSYSVRHKSLLGTSMDKGLRLQIWCPTPSGEFPIECGEIDGVVLGSWSKVVGDSLEDEATDNEELSGAYWAGALVWLQALDELTVDRIILEQSQASNIAWDSQLKYAVVHHSWSRVSSLIGDIPSSEVRDSELEIQLLASGGGAEVVRIPLVKCLTPNLSACSNWFRHLIERKTVANHIFLRNSWTGATDFFSLLSFAGLIFSGFTSGLHVDVVKAIRHLIGRYAVHYHLPWLLGMYFEQPSFGFDDIADFLNVVEDCPWAKWLLLSRDQRYAYEASLANAMAIFTGNKSASLWTIDDLATHGSVLVALSTLVHAPMLLQKCIYSGLRKQSGKSWLCALDQLQGGLKDFPTLSNTLNRRCLVGKPTDKDDIPSYLQWRLGLFSSADRETSLLALLPKWFPNTFKKILHFSVQGGGSGSFRNPTSWEESIKKQIGRHIHLSFFESAKNKVELQLLEGRPLAAFFHMMTLRADAGKPGDCSPINDVEEDVLSAVVPLALRNFKNNVVTAACSCFLELCGVSATMLRIDIAALRRIFDMTPSEERDISNSLIELLSKSYTQTEKSCTSHILEHLENATMVTASSQKGVSGLWLKTGEGDRQHVRTFQMSMSERWSLVTVFCRVHQLPLSTVYLRHLAAENDWVGFLAEAQSEGCPLDILLSVASKHFTDDHLRSHILTVLKSLSGRTEQKGSFQNNELFSLLAEVESHTTPGADLLQIAKSFRWPVLAVVASCFNDVSPLTCLAVWLGITADRKAKGISMGDEFATRVGLAVDTTNLRDHEERRLPVYSCNNAKRRRLMSSEPEEFNVSSESLHPIQAVELADGNPESLEKMVAVLCEQQQFNPLLRAFELFLPSSPLLHFVRFLRAFSQMRLSEASAHLADFSVFLKEEIHSKAGKTGTIWITKAAIAGANAILSACPSAYEKRCMLQLLAAADFGDGGVAAMGYRKFYWKIQLADPSLREERRSIVQVSDLEDEALLKSLETSGRWEDARSWARQLDLGHHANSSAVHHVTEMQAEAMVTEWRELLWDVPEQRAALWRHCQALFTKHSYPPLKAGIFFLKHAEDIEQHGQPAELHAVLLLALQWLSGSITGSAPVYPVPLLRELETRVWLLAVESEVLLKNSNSASNSNFRIGALNLESPFSMHSGSPVDRTAAKVATVDGHLKVFSSMHVDVADGGTGLRHVQQPHSKRRLLRRVQEKESSDVDRLVTEESPAGWEEKVGEGEVERAILALVEVGQVSAARQLQQKLSPSRVPAELVWAETAYNIAMLSSPTVKGSIRGSALGAPVMKTLTKLNLKDVSSASPLQAMEALTMACREGCGRGHCRRVTAVAQIANFLDLPFFEAFQKHPTELLQLLSLKGQDALSEAKLLVATHSINAASIARILAESFLKGLLAAHRGGYMDSSSKEEGPAPLLWRSSDFMQWGQLCPSEPELGHALMRLVISGHDMPHACEVELLILAHQFYESSACLDGMDVLVALAATRVESYVAEGDFSALARLVTGVSNFQALRFVLDLLIENGQLELLLKKRAAVDTLKESSASVRGFRMAVLSALKHFNPHDLDAFGMVFSHFSMAHEMANLLESRGRKGLSQWTIRIDPEQNEELLETMLFFVEASEVYAGIDCGNKTRWCCAQASLLSLQLRMPELMWLNLTETNARRLLVDQRRFQEALVVAEAYCLNQPAEWVPVLWNQVLSPGWIEHFLSEFVASLPLRPSMLMELARIYRSEVLARGDHLDFSKWLTSGMPPEITKSFRCILKHVGDFRLRTQLTTLASGFPDVLDTCARILDKVPDTAGPLVLKRGHGGTYVPLM